MKLKQIVIHSILIASLAITGVLALGGVVAADKNDGSGTGKCPRGNGVSLADPCVQANLRASGLSQIDAQEIVDVCEGDGGSNSSRGSCWNALGECTVYSVDANACKNGGLLADATDRCIADEGGCKAAGSALNQWDILIDDYNENHGGDDYVTNKGLRGDRQREYDANKENVCRSKYANDVGKYRTCLDEMGKAFTECYDALSGQHNGSTGNPLPGGVNNNFMTKKVDPAALDSCVTKDPRHRKYVDPIPTDLTTKEDCEAAQFEWVQVQGPYTAGGSPPGKCQYKPGQDPCEGHGGMKNDGSGQCNDGTTPTKNNVGTSPGKANNTDSEACGGARLVFFPSNSINGCSQQGTEAIGGVLKFVMTILSVGVGIIALGGVVYGAALYASARDNGGQTEQALTIIRNVVIGVLLYIFMITILNWLVPGGVIG